MMKKLLYLFAIGLTIGFGQSETKAQTCQAMFQYSVNGLTVQFQDSSVAPPGVTYTWDFGDLSTSNQMNPSHSYAQAGSYRVYLTIFNQSTCFDSTSALVVVANPNPVCTANFTIAKDTTTTSAVILTNNSSNFPSHNYFWDFGDSFTSNVRNPQHTYANFGSYNVCLTITDSLRNCSVTFCDSVGMDSLGNLKSPGFSMVVRDPISVSLNEENSNLNSITLFPNPAKDFLTVKMNSNIAVNLRLVDISGRTVFQKLQSTVNNIETIDLSNFENGFYFLILDDGRNQKTKKIIISH